MLHTKILSCAVALGLLLAGCAEKEDPTRETEKFTSIFDSRAFNTSYRPIDVLQTADGGYLILGERSLPPITIGGDPNDEEENDYRPTGIYMVKADKYGNFVKVLEVGDTLVNPVGKFTALADRFYFFCMVSPSATSGAAAEVKIASVDANLDGFTATSVAGLSYPAAASFASDRFILLSYNNGTRESVISEVMPTGTVGNSKGYTIGIGDKSEQPVMRHYLKTGRQFPFEAGMLSPGVYYFNGFYDFTFSLVFTDMDADEPLGVVHGQNDDGGLSALVPLGGSRFAASRFNFGDNYLLPNASLTTIGQSAAADLGGYNLREMLPDAKVRILRIPVNNKNVLVYAADTETRQIGLYFYDEVTASFMSARYLGFSNPFEMANLTATSDGGIAVVGTTYLAGRFPRICLFKLSKEEVAANVK